MFKRTLFFFSAVLLIFMTACTSVPIKWPDESFSAYTVEDDRSLPGRFAPVFIIENDQKEYNRIGTPTAKIHRHIQDNEEIIYVDPGKATLYTQVSTFETDRGVYTNLLYRIHFKEIPGGFFPFHLGAGKNIGLIVIITLDSKNRPVLFTSVHTCGCYLAFVPTSHTPADAFPDAWETGRQSVYSESLPGILEYDDLSSNNNRLTLLIRDGTHRVKDIWLSAVDDLSKYRNEPMEMQPFSSLEKLPLENHKSTSFYETSGPRKDYVKGSNKIRERLFMSWWALDWRIGEDKKLGKNEDDGIRFYTSLKPWSRRASDLRNFKTFLRYWEWKF